MLEGVLIPVSVGELFDKISILKIKLERIEDKVKIKNIELELRLLLDVAKSLPRLNQLCLDLISQLKTVNEAIWEAEEAIREFEKKLTYGKEFVAVAQTAYRNNDKRSEIKKQLNLLMGSSLVEEKSYQLPES